MRQATVSPGPILTLMRTCQLLVGMRVSWQLQAKWLKLARMRLIAKQCKFRWAMQLCDVIARMKGKAASWSSGMHCMCRQ